MLGGFATLFSFIAALGADGNDLILPTEWMHITVGLLTASTTVITTVSNQIGKAAMAAKHTAISNEYNMLAQHINWNINYPSKDAQEFADFIKTRLMQLLDSNKEIRLPLEIEKLNEIEQDSKKPCGIDGDDVRLRIKQKSSFKKSNHITELRDDFASDAWLTENTWKLIQRKLNKIYGADRDIYQYFREYCQEINVDTDFQAILDDLDDYDQDFISNSRIMDHLQITLDWTEDEQQRFVDIMRRILGKKNVDKEREHKSIFRPDFQDKSDDAIWSFIEKKLSRVFQNAQEIAQNFKQYSERMKLKFQDILDDLDDYDEDVDGESSIIDYLQDKFGWDDETVHKFQKVIQVVLTIKDNIDSDQDVETGFNLPF